MFITISKCLVPACNGASHRWEFERPTLREIQRIETATGLDLDAWGEGLNEALSTFTSVGIKATLALVDILHRRDGVVVPFDEIDIDPGDIDVSVEGSDADQTDEDQEDDGEGKDPSPAPTSPHPEPASDSTSGPSSEAESAPRSSTTPPTSGDGSASP